MPAQQGLPVVPQVTQVPGVGLTLEELLHARVGVEHWLPERLEVKGQQGSLRLPQPQRPLLHCP